MSIRRTSNFYGWTFGMAENNSQYGVTVDLTSSRGGTRRSTPSRWPSLGGGWWRVGTWGCFPHLDSPVLVPTSPFSPPPPGPPWPTGGVASLFEAQQALHDDASTLFPLLLCTAEESSRGRVGEAPAAVWRHTKPLDADPYAHQAAHNVRGLGWLAAVCGDGVMLLSDVYGQKIPTYPPT